MRRKNNVVGRVIEGLSDGLSIFSLVGLVLLGPGVVAIVIWGLRQEGGFGVALFLTAAGLVLLGGAVSAFVVLERRRERQWEKEIDS